MKLECFTRNVYNVMWGHRMLGILSGPDSKNSTTSDQSTYQVFNLFLLSFTPTSIYKKYCHRVKLQKSILH